MDQLFCWILTKSTDPLPTDAPVAPPTYAPTYMLTNLPTEKPTRTDPPTHTPVTGAPSTEKRCEIINGVFGDVGSSQFVTFAYEVETVKGDSIDSIVALLEVAMAEMILPLLFGAACPSVRRLSGRRLAASGVSILPVDEIVSERKSSSDNCGPTCLSELI